MINVTRYLAPRPIMKADTSKQPTASVPTTLPSWYKTEKDDIKRDFDYFKNGFQLAQDAMAK